MYGSNYRIRVNDGPVVFYRDSLEIDPIQEDSLQRVVDYQKNTTVMLLNLIQEVDGQYILDLSPSDASTLGIPDSLFLWAKYCVSCMNEK